MSDTNAVMPPATLLALALAASLPTVVPATAEPLVLPTITITDEVTGSIDDRMFGGFIELTEQGELGPEAAMDPATGQLRANVLAAIRDLAPPVLRYPGGGLVESPRFRWTQLIDGPTDGDAKDERRYQFGLHEFLDLCELDGISPMLVLPVVDQVRAFTPPDEVFAAARALVAYTTGELDDPDLPADLAKWPELRAANGRRAPWTIPYWQIGNEFVWVAVPHLRKKGWTDDDIASRYVDAVARTLAMIERLDPDAEIIVENYPEVTRVGLPVTDRLQERLGDRIDYLSMHQYYSWGIDRILEDGTAVDPAAFTPTDYWTAVVSAPGTDERGQALWREPLLAKTNAAGYPLALTEWNWNSWWQLPDGANPDFPESLWAKGVASASLLHGLLRAPGDLALATQSLLLGTEWDLRAIDVSEGRANPFPTGSILALHRAHHGSELLAWTPTEPLPTYRQPFTLGQLEPSAAVALLDCLVSRQSDGIVHAHLINRDPERELTLPIDLAPLGKFRSATQITLTGVPDETSARATGSALVEKTTTDIPLEANHATTLRLPARSVTAVTFTP